MPPFEYARMYSSENDEAKTAPASCALGPDPCSEGDDWTRAGGYSRP